MASFLLKCFFGTKYKINTLNCRKQNKQLRTKHTKTIMVLKIFGTPYFELLCKIKCYPKSSFQESALRFDNSVKISYQKKSFVDKSK